MSLGPGSYSPSPMRTPEPDPLCQVTPGTGMFLKVSHRISAWGGGMCHLRPCGLPKAVLSEMQPGRLPHRPPCSHPPYDRVHALS